MDGGKSPQQVIVKFLGVQGVKYFFGINDFTDLYLINIC